MTGSRDNKFWFGFFFGGLIGAIILFFLGTKEGQKMGKKFHTSGEDLIGDIQDRLEDLKKKGRELAQQSEQLKSSVLETVDGKKEKLTEEVTGKIDTALAHIEEIQERGRNATASLRKAFRNVPKKHSA